MSAQRISRLARIVAFNLALMLLLTEIVALGAYAFETGKLYYFSPPRDRSVAVDLTGGVEQFRLHPYFGFANRPSGVLNNGHGFVSPHDYPYISADPDEYIVGIFGGSVAAELAVFEREHRILASRLELALALREGQVRVLNFGLGGYKQPQQWLIYSYFRALGQELDLVINIDGFNEVALAGRNQDFGVEGSMPSFDHLKALRDVTGQASSLDSVERMLAIRSAWKKFARTFNRAWGGEGWELKTASGFLAHFLVYKYHLRRHRQLLERHTEAAGESGGDSWLMLEPATRTREAAATQAIRLWAESSLLLDRMQRADGKAYLHFVQPNQYFDTGRVFSEQERAIAFSDESVFSEYVRRDYARLVEEIEVLRQRGVLVSSLTGIFDAVEEPVYSDDCCHFNDLGQRLIAEAMVEAFLDGASSAASSE